jgi:lysophospholipase L1-like esterase
MEVRALLSIASPRAALPAHTSVRAPAVQAAGPVRAKATPPPPVNQSSPNEQFVERVYQDLLGRPASHGELVALGGALDNGRYTRLQVVQAVQTLPDARLHAVDVLYRTLLGRPAAPTELATAPGPGGTLDAIEVGILGSSEYYDRNGESEPDFIASLFRDVLGRPADVATEIVLLNALGRGSTRTDIAAFLMSGTQAYPARVTADFRRFLRQDPPDAALASGVSALQHGVSEGALIATLMASPTYFNANWEPTIPPGDPAAVATPNLGGGRLALHQALKLQAATGQAKVVFLGDSITALWSNHDPNVQAIFNKDFAPLKAGVFGIPGDATENLLWRLNDGELDGLNPGAIVLEIGANDILGDSPEQIAGGVLAVIQALKGQFPGVKVLVVGLLPRDGPLDPPGTPDTIRLTDGLLAKLDDGSTVRYLDVGSKMLNPDGTINSALFLPDRAHPSAAGYQVFADTLLPALQALLGSPAST